MKFQILPSTALSLALCAAALTLPVHAADDPQLALGKKLFMTASPACAVCHTLKDAGSEGAVGPVLDEIKPNAARVSQALLNGLGNMPSYKSSLTEAQIAALALYVSKVTGAAP